MPNPWDDTRRRRAVRAYEAGEGAYDDLAALFEIGMRTLQRWVQEYRAEGTLTPKPKGGGWRSPIRLPVLHALVAEAPDATCAELCWAYNRRAPTAHPRLLSNTVNIFAGLALLISVIGIYGLLSYTVIRRRRVIGVRMALGASRAGILTEILRWGLALVLIGTVAGASAAIALSQLITSLLLGIAATDATTLIAVVAGVMAVGTLACVIPAWRASRVDPLLLIREN